MNEFYTLTKKLQLKTCIKEVGTKARGYNVPSTTRILNEQLSALQEEYKALTGEYYAEFMPLNESNKQDELKNGIHSLCESFASKMTSADILKALTETAAKYAK